MSIVGARDTHTLVQQRRRQPPRRNRPAAFQPFASGFVGGAGVFGCLPQGKKGPTWKFEGLLFGRRSSF